MKKEKTENNSVSKRKKHIHSKNKNKMEQNPPTAKLIELYMKELVVKKNDLEPISGTPTYSNIKPLLDTIDKNLINMNDDRNIIC